MIKVLFATSECMPFIKTGGLGDVIGSLPKYFPKDEVDARVILPLYDCIDRALVSDLKELTKIHVNIFGADETAAISSVVRDGITFYFVVSKNRFFGSAPYLGIPQDLDKFAFFCKAVIAALLELNFAPDIIHCNDWQSGLIAPYIRELSKSNAFYAKIKTIMTIHNLRFQGSYNKDYVKEISGLDWEYFGDNNLGFYENGNLLKGGIVYADKITTVSDTYALEICTPFYGEGLDGLLSYRSRDLCGIVNGIDYTIYDPMADRYIFKNYSAENFRREKKKNKTALQKELHMNVDPKVMMIGIVSRLTDQKGIDLIAYMMDELCQDSIQLVILGTGEEKYESMFKHYAWKYGGDVSANIFFSEELSHKIYAGCDAFLMPSLFEPCGLSQMMAMRYGCVPIVRETGGLKDTVLPYNEYEHTGNGFSFANYNAHEMLGTIRYAQRIFYDNKRDWNKISENAMKMDYSWKASAAKYVSLYKSLTGK